MDYKDLGNWGQQMGNRVREAIESLDFDQLNQDIRRTADDVISGMKNSMHRDYDPWNPAGEAYKKNQNTSYQYKEAAGGGYAKSGEGTASNTYTYGNSSWRNGTSSWQFTKVRPAPRNDYGFPVSRTLKGEVSGILLTVFGAIGFGITSLICLFLIFTAIIGIDPLLMLTVTAGFLPFEIGFLAMIAIGQRQRRRIKRFRKYIECIRGKNFGTFKQLASLSGRTEKFVAKDVQKMLALDYLPEGHIDEQKTCVMTTNAMYEQYLKLMENMKTNRVAEDAGTEHMENAQNKDARQNQTDEVEKLGRLGQSYIETIRRVNDDIPDTEISNKLYRMELIVEKIFEEVKRHPQKADRLTQFENYYMPMTIKLLETYRDLDAQPIHGDNIKKTKKDIEATLDTINEAYEKLYDSMYSEMVMDVASDISVLQTLLAREGLTKGAFDKK